MRLRLNGEDVDVPEPMTVEGLLRHLGRDPGVPGVAVAVNAEVLAIQAWGERALRDGDRVDIVVAVGGG
jgi:sulfur carrier protein